ETYITDGKQKIDMYKRFQTAREQEDLDDLQEELIDRFGDYPQEVANLFTVSKLKMYAKREWVESIREKKQKLELLIDESRSQRIDGSKLFTVANEFGRNVQLGTADKKLKVVLTSSGKTKDKRYDIILNLLDQLATV